MKRPYKAEALRWLTQAKDESADADELRQWGRFCLALFHFQQAAEEAMKAYPYLKVKSVEIFYTHSLDEFLKMAVEADKAFRTVSAAKKLDRYYLLTRYPNSLPGGVLSRAFDDPLEAEQASQMAKGVIELVDAKVGEEPSRPPS